jgi:hypothetical protein
MYYRVIKDIITRMNSSDMASLVPDPNHLLAFPVEEQGRLILKLMANCNSPEKAVAHSNFFNRAGDSSLYPPKYGNRQKDVDAALMEAWSWLESRGLVTRKPTSTGNWVYVGKAGRELLALGEIEGLLAESHEARRDAAWWGRAKSLIGRWNPAKSADAKAAEDLFFANLNAIRKGADERHRGENQMLTLLNEAKHDVSTGELRRGSIQAGDLTLIAESRLEELRALQSPQFDFKKLIRLCEELNAASREHCYLSVGMLTRALLDHVPPVFSVRSFSEVANNYVGGSKSFKDTMLHLDTAAKKIADGFLHTQIRKTETLPTAQQVNFGPALDLLLAEIVRIT